LLHFPKYSGNSRKKISRIARKIMLLHLSFLYKVLVDKGIHIHFVSQNCKVESKIKHSLHYNILADSGNFKKELRDVSTLNEEKGNLYLSFQNCLITAQLCKVIINPSKNGKRLATFTQSWKCLQIWKRRSVTWVMKHTCFIFE